MNGLVALMRAERAEREGARHRVFDWHTAAYLILNGKPKEVSAGLGNDWEWTGGSIYVDGKPVPQSETYTYLASNWAEPEIEIDGEIQPCWVYVDESPGWNADTYWPDSALAILNGAISE